MRRGLIRVLGILATAGLFVATSPGTVHASAAPASECHASPPPAGHYTCNVYESDGMGNPSEVSNSFAMNSIPTHEFIALVENPGANRSDPHNWSDLLVIGNPQAGMATGQLFSQGCGNAANPLDISCYPATQPNNLMLVDETSTGQGDDFTDSTLVQFGADIRVFSDCACPADVEGGPPGVEVPDAPLAVLLPLAACGVLALAARRRRSATR